MGAVIMVILLKILAEWCCRMQFTTDDPAVEHCEPKESTVISESVPCSGKQIEELRTEIKLMLMSQQDPRKAAVLEDVIVEIDYLPVYEEKEGKLQYGGTKEKVVFSEVRPKPEDRSQE